MSEVLTPIVYQLGIGGILGFIAGYATKKMIKVLAVLTGLFALALIYLGYQGIINVNYGKLAEIVESSMSNIGQASRWIAPIVASLPFAGSFMVGAALGLKIG